MRARSPRAGARSAWQGLVFLAALAAPLGTGGCIDFLDPQLPPPSPAIAQLFLHVTGPGTLQFEAQLAPGMSLAHEWRNVPHDSLIVAGHPVAPDSVHSNNARDYRGTVSLAGPAGPVTVQVPAVEGLSGTPPLLSWSGIRRVDSDTVSLLPGADLVLHVDTTLPAETPPPARQWFLNLFAGGHNFQLGADGLPPAVLRVPPQFVPGDTATYVTASLLILTSGQMTVAGGNYILNASMDQHLNWVVVRRKGTP
ncbi:MAG TPA: hypothetical protein VF832_06200 [Longimicrobiales bacterium]